MDEDDDGGAFARRTLLRSRMWMRWDARARVGLGDAGDDAGVCLMYIFHAGSARAGDVARFAMATTTWFVGCPWTRASDEGEHRD